jgi:hypothetical protein
MFLWVIATFATSNNPSLKNVQVFEPLIKGIGEVWRLRSSMCLHQSGKLPQVTNTSNVRCSIIMSSTHCVDNANHVHIRDEDGIEEEHCLNVHEEELSIEEEEKVPIEEGEEENLEGIELALKTKAY